MKHKIFALMLMSVTLAVACGKSESNSGNGGTITVAGPNVMVVGVNDLSQCNGVDNYVNEPCTTVKICQPGTSNCQTINNILVDTGSYGLRIFSQAVSLNLTNMPDPAHSATKVIGECAQFGTGNEWGPVATADVYLASEPVISSIPIEIVDSTYATISGPCASQPSKLETSPVDVGGVAGSGSGYNGIIGVGLLVQDCPDCVTNADQIYYSCLNNGSACTATTLPLANQVANPVAFLPVDNNGVVMLLPGVGDIGAGYITGALVLGIGTETNNTPTTMPVVLGADSSARFTTVYNSTTYTQSSFIDSGSNGLFFPSPTSGSFEATAADCVPSNSVSPWICPKNHNILTETAQNRGIAPNIATVTTTFFINDAVALFNSNNQVYSNLGSNMNGGFDWGLPFFMGRTVYVGFTDTGTHTPHTMSIYAPTGSGPFWAY